MDAGSLRLAGQGVVPSPRQHCVPGALWEQLRGGPAGFKVHKNAALTVADASGVQGAIHPETLNGAGFAEKPASTFARTVSLVDMDTAVVLLERNLGAHHPGCEGSRSLHRDSYDLDVVGNAHVKDAWPIVAWNHADTAVAFEMGEPYARWIRLASRCTEGLVEVHPGDVALPHRGAVDISIFDEQDRMAFDERTEPVEVIGEGRQQPMQRDEDKAGEPGREKPRCVRDGAAHDRADHDCDDEVERRPLAQQPFVPKANDCHRH
jgi:hypothetical protein